MIEIVGNLWEVLDADARCITTNGTVTRFPGLKAVMGRGVAKQAKLRYPGVDSYLGLMILDHGNVPHILIRDIPEGGYLVSYPVKHQFRDNATKYLIIRSAHLLKKMADDMGWEKIYLPRPGCGAGRLEWSSVRPSIENTLDDRFIIINNEEQQ